MQRFPGDASKRSLQIKERWRVAGVTMYATRGDTAGEGEEGGSSNPLEGGYQGEELLQPTNGMEIACKALEAVLGTCHKANTSRVGKRGLMPFCNSISREI